MALAVALLVWVWPRLQAKVVDDVRRDLLLDGARVELLEGFEGVETLHIWNDAKLTNHDRDEIALPMRRNARLRWNAEARPGALRLSAARLSVGADGDDSPCLVIVSATVGGLRQTVQLALPATPPDASAAPGVWREGPATPLVLNLPDGAPAIEIETRSENPPDGGAVALLSPRLEMRPAALPVAGLSVDAPRALRLAPLTPSAAVPVEFALRSVPSADGGAPVEERVALPGVQVLASFSGSDERPALALTGAAEAVYEVDLEPGVVLRGDGALDERLPPGAAATLLVEVDGRPAGRLRLDGRSWRPLAVPLDAHAGRARRLSLRLDEVELQPAAVLRQDADLAAGVYVPASWTALAPRAGLSDLRLEVARRVPARTSEIDRRSLILIQVETLRADVLPLYGSLRGTAPPDLTPHLDALAADGVVFDLALTPSPWTLPTSVSLLTGLPPRAHNAVNHDLLAVPGDAPTLAERAREAGLATGAVVASDILRPHAGFARGFSSYAHVPYANARQVNDLAGAFLENHVGRQFLLFLHYFDPHGPLNAPGAWRDRYVEPGLADRDVPGAEGRLVAAMREGRAPAVDDPDARFLMQRYWGEIAWFDSQLGALLAGLERLGLDDEVVIALTSDHGEEFLEHGLYGHGSQLHDETLHVPLVVRAPRGMRLRWERGARVAEVRSTTALHASALAWLGVAAPEEALQAPLEAPRSFAISETSKGLALDGRGDPLRRYLAGVRTAQARLEVRESMPGEEGGPSIAYYDLRSDPLALRPLPAESEEARRLVQLLGEAAAWADAHRTAAPAPAGGQQTFEMLKALGYIEGSGAR